MIENSIATRTNVDIIAHAIAHAIDGQYCTIMVLLKAGFRAS